MAAAASVDRYAMGTRVVTTKDVGSHLWTPEMMATRRWGVHGRIESGADAQGFYYVRHEDEVGTRSRGSWYAPCELTLAPPENQTRLDTILAQLKPSLRDELEPLRQRIAATLAGKSRSYVEDSRVYALIVRDCLELRLDFAQAIVALTEVQERCDALLEENRALRARLRPPSDPAL
jgi:hypothetical protein